MMEYVTSNEAAQRLGVTRQSVVIMIKRGALRGRKVRGTRWMVEVASIDELMSMADAIIERKHDETN